MPASKVTSHMTELYHEEPPPQPVASSYALQKKFAIDPRLPQVSRFADDPFGSPPHDVPITPEVSMVAEAVKDAALLRYAGHPTGTAAKLASFPSFAPNAGDSCRLREHGGRRAAFPCASNPLAAIPLLLSLAPLRCAATPCCSTSSAATSTCSQCRSHRPVLQKRRLSCSAS